jgi:hypothetical protein
MRRRIARLLRPARRVCAHGANHGSVCPDPAVARAVGALQHTWLRPPCADRPETGLVGCAGELCVFCGQPGACALTGRDTAAYAPTLLLRAQWARCKTRGSAPRAPIGLKPGSLDAPENCASFAASPARVRSRRETRQRMPRPCCCARVRPRGPARGAGTIRPCASCRWPCAAAAGGRGFRV